MSILNNVIRIGIGSMFIIAAILKLISIDEFEIYIYSFNVFSYLITTIFSRLLIAGELILGLFFIFKIHYKIAWRIMMVVQILFTIFLLYVTLFRHDANCHCFGDLIELSPMESIVKNIVIIGLLFTVRSQHADVCKHRSWYSLLIVNCTLLIVFIVSPPDSIYKMIYSTEKEISTMDLYDVELQRINNDVESDETLMFDFDAGEYLIAVVSSGCKYCYLGVKKLAMIMKRKGLNTEDVHIFIWGSDEDILNFIEETETENYSYWKIEPRQAIEITYGRFPTFIWMKDKEIVKVGNFRDIDENSIQ